MDWLLPAITATLTSSIVLFLVYAYLNSQEHEKFLVPWTASWGLYALRFVFLIFIVATSRHPVLLSGNQLCSLWSAYLLLRGAGQFSGHPVSRWWLMGTAAGSAWILAAAFVGVPFLWLTLPTFSFMALAFIWTGWIFWRLPDPPGIGAKILGGALVIWGVHKFNYPFLQPVAWFAPWGYLLGALLALITAVGLILLYFQKTKNDLARSEEHHRRLLMTAMDGFWRADMEGRLLEVNEAYCRMSGYDRSELLSMNISDLEVVEGRDELMLHLEKLAARGHDRFESRHRRRDGSLLDVEVSVRYLEEEHDSFCVAFLRDITERRLAEEKLRASEETYRTLVNTAPYGIQLTDREGKILFSNPAHHKIQGYQEGELVGRYIWDLMATDELRDAAREYYQAIIRDQPRPEVYFNQDITNDGRLIDAQINWDYVRDALGEVVAVISIISDITEQKRAEEEHKKLQVQLAQAQKMDALGTLAGGIAHDFNNLLAAIMGYTELTQDELPPDTPVRQFLAAITKAATKAKNLVRQILTFSRAIEGLKRPLAVNTVIDEARSILGWTIPKMINLEFDLQADLGPVKGDGGQLEQVIINLVGNAADAIDGEGGIRITTREVSLDMEPCDVCGETMSGRYVKISVADNGTGMSSEVRSKIFEPFFTTKEVGKGTGLGLSAAYGIVTGHDGHICCTSREGEGAEFTVYLPVTEGPAAEPGLVEPDDDPGARGSGTVLVVDDEQFVRDIAHKMITRAGYRVLQAESGEEALEVLAGSSDDVDLVLMDLGMPGMGGKACLKEIQRLDPRAKVIIASGYIESELAEELMGLGAAGVLAKPYRKAELLQKVQAILSD